VQTVDVEDHDDSWVADCGDVGGSGWELDITISVDAEISFAPKSETRSTAFLSIVFISSSVSLSSTKTLCDIISING